MCLFLGFWPPRVALDKRNGSIPRISAPPGPASQEFERPAGPHRFLFKVVTTGATFKPLAGPGPKRRPGGCRFSTFRVPAAWVDGAFPRVRASACKTRSARKSAPFCRGFPPPQAKPRPQTVAARRRALPPKQTSSLETHSGRSVAPFCRGPHTPRTKP